MSVFKKIIVVLFGSLGLAGTIFSAGLLLIVVLTGFNDGVDPVPVVYALIAFVVGSLVFLISAGKLRQPLYLLVPLGAVAGFAIMIIPEWMGIHTCGLNPIVLGIVSGVVVIGIPLLLSKWIKKYYERKNREAEGKREIDSA